MKNTSNTSKREQEQKTKKTFMINTDSFRPLRENTSAHPYRAKGEQFLSNLWDLHKGNSSSDIIKGIYFFI